MLRFPHLELITENPRAQGKDAQCVAGRKRFSEMVASVSIPPGDCTDAAPCVEKDGTGIGAGYDMGCLPALGIRSVPAQDVIWGHGRPRTPNAALTGALALPFETVH